MKFVRRIIAWWRSRNTITLYGDHGVAVSAAVRDGEYTVTVNGATHTVCARWYDTPTTIAWKLRRKLR